MPNLKFLFFRISDGIKKQVFLSLFPLRPDDIFAGKMVDGARMFKKHSDSGLFNMSFDDLPSLKEGLLDKLGIDKDPNFMTLLRFR